MKYFAPLKILHPFIRSFVNPFIDISLTFPDRSFSFFSTSTYLVLFEVTFLLIFTSFLSKSAFFLRNQQYHF